MDSRLHARAGGAARPGARVSRGDAGADLGAARRARLDRAPRSRRSTAAPDSASSRRRCSTRSSGARSSTRRSGRRRACCPPLAATTRRRSPRARRAGRSRSARSSPTSTPRPSVAVVGGDGIWQLVGFERELLATNDETRPLGVVSRRRARAARSLDATCSRRSARGRWRPSRSRPSASAHARSSSRSSTSRTREQFGRTIGTYQAVSHPLATLVHGARARALARLWAAWCVANDEPDAAVAAAAAKAQAAEAAVAACERAIQAHGGIGFTWEHVLHRLYKRALWIQSWEASSAQLRAEVACHLLDGRSDGGGA